MISLYAYCRRVDSRIPRYPRDGEFGVSIERVTPQIQAPVHDVHDMHSRFPDTVENQVFAYRKAAIASADFVSLPTGVGHISQQSVMVCQLVNETLGGGLVVFGNAPPDVEYITARTSGQAVKPSAGLFVITQCPRFAL
jgi:hypothetical protein